MLGQLDALGSAAELGDASADTDADAQPLLLPETLLKGLGESDTLPLALVDSDSVDDVECVSVSLTVPHVDADPL